MTMTLVGQAAVIERQYGRVTDKRPNQQQGRPKRRTCIAAYKARILAAYDALPEGSPERGALMRKERLYHSHIEHWRKQQEKGMLIASTGKSKKDPKAEEPAAELARLRAENKKLRTANAKLSGELDKTKTALDIAGKAFALLQTSQAARDSDAN